MITQMSPLVAVLITLGIVAFWVGYAVLGDMLDRAFQARQTAILQRDATKRRRP